MAAGDIEGDDIPTIVANMYAYADDVAARIGWPDSALRLEYHRHLTMLFSQGYVQNFSTRVEAPDFVPHTGALFPWGAPNHDTLYTFAPIDRNGLYRISGTRGTETISAVMLRRFGANTGQVHGTPMGEIDVLEMAAKQGDPFSFLLSAERPAGHDGDWYPLHPETTGLNTRHVTTLASQIDGTWAIERLDREPSAAHLADADILASMRNAASFASKLNEFLMGHVRGLRSAGINMLEPTRYPNHGGLADQLYFQGAYSVADDEALILECELPDKCHYWSVQLLDAFYAGIDAVMHQSSLNGDQVVADGDRSVRLVICNDDPGVANWLDTGGWRDGSLIWRWHSASTDPKPTLRRIKLIDLAAELPLATVQIDRVERDAARRARIVHYQNRRRW